jgi:hypothetical protein
MNNKKKIANEIELIEINNAKKINKSEVKKSK